MESTRALILRIQAGDAEARERLISRFLPGLRRWAHGRLPQRARDLSETDDLVQVAFQRALPHIERFDPRREGAFMAYLHQILMNLIREEIRRVTRRPSSDPLPEDLPEDRPALLERTIGNDALSAYEDALTRLPEEVQQAVVLRIEFGFSHQEIADMLGRPSANAVRMQITRGLVRLTEKMDAYRR
jgi:RNA polymerase sigma-70 factor (ECF subfamily)